MANQNLTIKTCKGCGSDFTVLNFRQKYCTKSCQKKTQSARETAEQSARIWGAKEPKPCHFCGKPFIGRGTAKYCSVKCRDEEAKRLSKKRARVPGKYIGVRSCKVCGSNFKAYKGRREKYCSKECRDNDYSASQNLNFAKREKQLEKITGQTCPVYYRKCLQCQSVYAEKPTYHKFIFCSVGCSEQYQKENQEFEWRWRKGHELTSLRICPETGYIFKPTSTRQRFYNREAATSFCKRVGVARRRAILRGSESEAIDPFYVFDRAGWKCECCGKETPKKERGSRSHNAPELDHIYPLSKGGSHTLNNVQLLCWQCNSSKGDKTPEEWEQHLNSEEEAA